jgi:phosphotransferase family enzyme
MLDVIPAVHRLLPGLLTHAQPSVACVYTTRPKYLVFDGSAEQPACVVEFGDAQRLAQVQKVLGVLSPRLPGTVPASLRCAPWHGGGAIHVQQGLPGTPWFRVADGVQTAGDWIALLERACRELAAFHAAVRDEPAWSALVYPGMELRRQAMLSRFRGIALSARVLECVEEWSHDADRDGPMRSCWQHGDFSLNNLLVSPRSLAIIDFDEFGRTRVPLHDAFGLALSVPLSQEGQCPLSIAECVQRCVEAARKHDDIDPRLLPALLLHHLLWRINQCDGLARRDALRRVLLRWTDELTTTPENFLGTLAAAHA